MSLLVVVVSADWVNPLISAMAALVGAVIGGGVILFVARGAGIRSFGGPEELEHADLDLGLDGTALVQEQLPAEGEFIVRIEILDGDDLYGSHPARARRLQSLSRRLLRASRHRGRRLGAGRPMEAHDLREDVVEDARRIVAAAGMDVAGVEYLTNARDRRPTFYDLNALSNFVADAPTIVGFDPFARLVDFILDRAASLSAVG